MRNCVLAATTALLAAAPASAALTEVWDSYGNDGTHFNRGAAVGELFGSIDFVASSFVPDRTGRVERFEAAITRGSYVPEAITIRLLSGVGTGTPASNTVWSQTYDGSTVNPLASAGLSSPSVFAVTDGPVLEAGTEYFLFAEIPLVDPANDRERVSWWQTPVERSDRTTAFWNAPDAVNAPDTFEWDVFPGSRSSAFRVIADVPAVPEPTSLAVLTAPTLLLRRRRI